MEQFSYDKKELGLRVLKSPLLVRVILFIITFLCFSLPLLGIVINVADGHGVKLISILILGIFSLMGFYLLRISLWNHIGREIIQFKSDEIVYIADYGWFKDGKKVIENNEITFSIKPVGYEDENKGVLVISNTKSEIESAVKMSKQKLEKLIEELQYCYHQQL